MKCHSLLSSVTLAGAPFFRPVNRTGDEPPVQCREQPGITDGQILISLIPLFTVLPSSLHELHDRGRALGFRMKPYSGPLSPDGWKLLSSHCGQHQFLFRNKTNDGSPPVFPPGKCAVHSPPGRKSTTVPGVSHVLKPALVVNACQTAARGAGTVTSKVRTRSGVACRVTLSAFWPKAIEATANSPRQKAFMHPPKDNLVDRSSKCY